MSPAPEGRARPLVLAAPSGTGKTTIARRLVEGPGSFVFSVSATTRAPRPAERDGVDYDFVEEGAFRRMVEEGELVEWAEVHGRLYGTPWRNVETAASKGEHVVLDIDVQGARQIRERIPDALLVFVLPPSAASLVARLSGRGTEERSEMLRRLRNAREEIESAAEFDHAVVNEELEVALDAIRTLAAGGEPPPAVAKDVAAEVRRLRGEIDDILARDFPGEAAGTTREKKEA